ncbi:hypothetical protein [Streptomyces sp. NPDC021562]|uniref:hypothetical protein n=1 Tax=Streptomyces sp. NPDC021562 TaxID=3155121 RepID=UPI0033FBA3E9
MSESPSTELASQYAERIQQDLDLNAAEIAALEAQLRALRENRVVLERLRQALGPQAGAAAPDAAEGAESSEAREADPAPASPGDAKGAEVTVAVVPRQKTGPASSGAADSGSAKASADTAGRGRARSRKASPRKASPRKAGTDKATPAEASSSEAKPSLVGAVRAYLEQQREPRSAVEVAEAIRSGQPGRTIKTTVIRTTLESLVARNLAQRSKQGRSVFYTPTAAAQDTA